MTRATSIILITLMGLLSTSCSWFVHLIVANDSREDILVRYLVPSDSVNSQFYRNPKVYKFDEELMKLSKVNKKKRPSSIPADVKILEGTNELEVKLKPGQAVHVGFYLSFQARQDIIFKNDLKVLFKADSLLTANQINENFRHGKKNIRTDILKIASNA